MYCEVKESFDKKFPLWIIAYCPDNNSWFVTNERGFYYEYPDKFKCENDAIIYFTQNIKIFYNTQNPMNHWQEDEITLETTKYIRVYKFKKSYGDCCFVCKQEVCKNKI